MPFKYDPNTLFGPLLIDMDQPRRISGSHPQSCQCTGCMFTKLMATPKRPFEVSLELAGIKRGNIKVTLKGELLNIQWTTRYGELKNQSTHVGGKYYDLDKIDCTLVDGLLTITVPLKELKVEEPPIVPEINIEIK